MIGQCPKAIPLMEHSCCLLITSVGNTPPLKSPLSQCRLLYFNHSKGVSKYSEAHVAITTLAFEDLSKSH